MKIALFIFLLAVLAVLYRVFSARARGAHQRGKQSSNGQPGSSDHRHLMSRDKAAALLGLEGPYNQQDVISAHRRLMQKVHPDKGGSVALAQELNEAKRVLLRPLDD